VNRRDIVRYQRAMDAIADLVLLTPGDPAASITLHGASAGSALSDWAETFGYTVHSERCTRTDPGGVRITWTVLYGIVDGHTAIIVHLSDDEPVSDPEPQSSAA